MKKSTAPTMKDVAVKAGVAIGTVSKYVNGGNVREEYAEKIRQAISELGYQVNSYAQGLKADRTRNIAVLLPNLTSPFYAMLANSIASVLQEKDYRMMLSCTDFDSNLEQKYISLAQQNMVDGIICLTYSTSLKVSPDIPVVSIDRSFGPKTPCVASDNFAGGQLAAQKLSALGCRHVLFLREGSDLDNEPNKRKAGFENGCAICGLPCEEVILSDDDPDHDGAFRAYLQGHMKNGRLAFDGIFCVTDQLAYRILGILRSLSVRVPEDVQLIGFDGIRKFGELDCYCSTIVQPVADIARMCVDLLLADPESLKPPLVCLPVSYQPGGTTREGS